MFLDFFNILRMVEPILPYAFTLGMCFGLFLFFRG